MRRVCDLDVLGAGPAGDLERAPQNRGLIELAGDDERGNGDLGEAPDRGRLEVSGLDLEAWPGAPGARG